MLRRRTRQASPRRLRASDHQVLLEQDVTRLAHAHAGGHQLGRLKRSRVRRPANRDSRGQSAIRHDATSHGLPH